ncbi:MAG: Cupin 2 conserved barrel domain protein [Myxococcaceae bacterium]|nr:Cupin 2 conserved barrel domain protein [Myxococcaceae bacterium]
MAVIPCPATWTHELPHARFTSLATPKTGSSETSVWRVQLSASAETVPHSLTREEIFVVLSGTVRVELAGKVEDAQTGDAIVVPKDTQVTLSCVGADAEVLCCLPVGGQARVQDGPLFTPPWAQ